MRVDSRAFRFTPHTPSVSSRVTGKRGILILGLLLIVASHAMRWYSAGPWAAALGVNDLRVKAALAAVAAGAVHRRVANEGEVERAWLRGDDRGYTVNLTVTLDDNPWHVTVVFSPEGVPIESAVSLSGAVLAPMYMERLGYCAVSLWLVVVFLVPRVFGRKCPDCLSSFWKPALLDTVETTVYPGGFDDDGYSVDPIARRDFVCPRCGYRRVTYFVPLDRNPGKAFRAPVGHGRPTVKQEQVLQRILDDWWEDNPKRTKFHTYDEWRTFYDELKASEREERTGTVR